MLGAAHPSDDLAAIGPLIDRPPLFVRDGEWFVPSVRTAGPWSPDAMHGGPPAALLAWAVESFRAGGLWLARELAYLGRPWGFALDEVRAPVTLWWGERDRVCPPSIWFADW